MGEGDWKGHGAGRPDAAFTEQFTQHGEHGSCPVLLQVESGGAGIGTQGF